MTIALTTRSGSVRVVATDFMGCAVHSGAVSVQPAPRLTCVASSNSAGSCRNSLELDCTLLALGSGPLWARNDWPIEFSGKNRPPLKGPLTVRKNVYRVLLTRGRDVTVVYVPDDRRMDETFERLTADGIRVL